MNNAIFHPKVRELLRRFPEEVRAELGRAIFLLQHGETLSMPLSRSMPRVAPRVSELRVRGSEGIYRVFYLAKPGKGVIVFHAFVKKTRNTPPLELALARKRLGELGYA